MKPAPAATATSPSRARPRLRVRPLRSFNAFPVSVSRRASELRGGGLDCQRCELRRLHESYDTEVLTFHAIGAIERDGRRTEDAEVLEQRLILTIVGGDVRLQQHGVAQRS